MNSHAVSMGKSTITSKGRTTVPLHVRKSFGIAPGERLIWQILDDGRLFVRVRSKSTQQSIQFAGIG